MIICRFYMDVSENSGFPPQIIHFNKVFHDFHHPFWGGLCTPDSLAKPKKRSDQTLLGDCEGTSDGLHNLTPLIRPHFLGGNRGIGGLPGLIPMKRFGGWKGSSSNPSFLGLLSC